MTIRASCTACGVKLVAEDRYAGKTLPCPGCQQPVSVPPPTSAEEFVDPFAEEAERVLAPRRPVGAIPAKPIEKNRTPKPSAKREVPPQRPPTTPAPQAQAVPPHEEDFIPDEPPPEPIEIPQLEDSSFPDLTEAELAGEVISPRRKKKPPVSVPATSVAANRERQRRPIQAKSSSVWRDHLHWILILTFIPLALPTLLGREGHVREWLHHSVESHPEVNPDAVLEAATLQDAAMLFPDHRIDGAWLAADTFWHWGCAFASGAAFGCLLLWMWPEKDSRAGQLLMAAGVSGMMGYLLILGFQKVAQETEGLMVSGRGIATPLYDIAQFVGDAFRPSEVDSGGFLSRVFGITVSFGLCAALCQSLPVALYIRGRPQRSWRQVCLIGLASGVGFGLAKGIVQSSAYDNGIQEIWIPLIRFTSSVTLHAIWSGGVALLMFRHRDRLEFSMAAVLYYLGFCWLAAMCLHGVYDTLLNQGRGLWAILPALVSWAWFQWLLWRTPSEL